MPAAATDKFKKLSRRWTGQIGAGAVADGTTQTIPLASVTNLPTDTAVVAVIDRVDANGNATPNLEETIIGVVSGSNLTNSVRGAEGTAQGHIAGAVVEILVTAKGYNDIIDGILVEHNQNGTHNITITSVNGNTVPAGSDTVALLTATQTFTNKRRTRRVVSVTQSATPAINSDNADVASITGLAQAITSMTSSLTGTPVDGDLLEIRIKDNGTARGITWGASFGSSTVTLPTTTVISTTLRVGFEWSSADSLWRCIATA